MLCVYFYCVLIWAGLIMEKLTLIQWLSCCDNRQITIEHGKFKGKFWHWDSWQCNVESYTFLIKLLRLLNKRSYYVHLITDDICFTFPVAQKDLIIQQLTNELHNIRPPTKRVKRLKKISYEAYIDEEIGNGIVRKEIKYL